MNFHIFTERNTLQQWKIIDHHILQSSLLMNVVRTLMLDESESVSRCHVWLFVTPDCSPPGSSVHGILQARTLEWVAMPSSREFSQIRDWTQVSCIELGFFYLLSHQGSPKILEWVAYHFFRRTSHPRNWTWVSCFAGRFFTSQPIREARITFNSQH